MNNNDEIEKNEKVKEVNDHEANKRLLGQDLQDSEKDQEKLQNESVVMDLPDVSDIPGQESIVVPKFGEMADTTIASDDEEGVGLFEDDEEDEDTDLVMGNDSDVTDTEKDLLQKADQDMPVSDDERLRKAELDKTDNEGETLNEGSLATDVSGGDLDTAIVDADDEMENIGEEDEENNPYSLGSDSNDNITEGTP